VLLRYLFIVVQHNIKEENDSSRLKSIQKGLWAVKTYEAKQNSKEQCNGERRRRMKRNSSLPQNHQSVESRAWWYAFETVEAAAVKQSFSPTRRRRHKERAQPSLRTFKTSMIYVAMLCIFTLMSINVFEEFLQSFVHLRDGVFHAFHTCVISHEEVNESTNVMNRWNNESNEHTI
jgi:hypothetical protein